MIEQCAIFQLDFVAAARAGMPGEILDLGYEGFGLLDERTYMRKDALLTVAGQDVRRNVEQFD